MLKELRIVISESLDAHRNQAIEAALLDTARHDTAVLYLWSNLHAVFIGKNQNAHLECNVDLLLSEGGTLARRITGGGAVYHDKGNLNYSFIAGKALYDEARQFQIVLAAIRSLGLDAVLNGRNDLTIDGRKFSGNAFYKSEKGCLHHGTILIKSDSQKIARYLTASKLKLKSKGVESISSRIMNLSEIRPEISKDDVIAVLVKSAQKEYGKRATSFSANDIDRQSYDKWYKFLSDKQRLLGDNVVYDARIEKRFDWGTADIRLKLEGSRVVAAKIYTDALDPSLAEIKEKALIGQDIYNIENDEARDIIEAHINGI